MNPVLVNRWRGNAIECRHRGAVSVVDTAGRTVLALGDVQRPVFPRSAVKFLQAIPFVESGAIERYGLDDRHIALACASHNGEPQHVGLARDWLTRLGLGHDALECGAELPLHVATRYELLGEGRGPERIHHNCSGKHVGMLATALHRGEAPTGYRLYEHAVQRRWFDVLGAFRERAPAGARVGLRRVRRAVARAPPAPARAVHGALREPGVVVRRAALRRRAHPRRAGRAPLSRGRQGAHRPPPSWSAWRRTRS